MKERLVQYLNENQGKTASAVIVNFYHAFFVFVGKQCVDNKSLPYDFFKNKVLLIMFNLLEQLAETRRKIKC